MLYNLYVFNKRGVNVYYREWSRPQNTLEHDAAEEKRLMFGMSYSLQQMMAKLSGAPDVGEKYLTLGTDSYTMHCFVSASGLRFILNSDRGKGDMQQLMKRLFSEIFVEYVVGNPDYNPLSSDPIDLPAFDIGVENLLASFS